MFRVEDSHEFDWPVEINKPVGVDTKGGPRFETHRIAVTFLALPLDEAAWAVAPLEDGEDAPEPREPLLQRVVRGWGGVHDEEGEPLPFTPENLRRLTRIGYVGAAFTDAYFQALTGRAEKN